MNERRVIATLLVVACVVQFVVKFNERNQWPYDRNPGLLGGMVVVPLAHIAVALLPAVRREFLRPTSPLALELSGNS